MKKITFLLLLFFVCSFAFAQRVEPTFVWSNKSDYQINGESAVTFKPGDVVTIEIAYTLGSTDDIEDAYSFILGGLQDEAMAGVDPLTGTWANETVAQPNDYQFPPAGSGGVTSFDYTIPADAELNSDNANLTYRILVYLAYTPDGGGTTYGGPGASDPTLVYIRSQAEIDALLSIENFNKSKLDAFYSSNIDSVIITDRNAIGSDYKFYDLTGRTVMEGEVSEEINVSNLKTGLYILATNNGVLKFAK